MADDELNDFVEQYKAVDLDRELASYAGLMAFSVRFYHDVAGVYDALTRLKNTSRNPTGFSLNDAPILGLLVRIWKLLKELVKYYARGNGDMVAQLHRQIVEAAITARYLLVSEDSVVEDYRKCSYKNRVLILEQAARDPDAFDSPGGARLLASIRYKLRREGLTPDSFETQRQNRWRLQGKTFADIFSAVDNKEYYKFLYGMASEALHGSWNESLDYDLSPEDDGTFSTYPLHQDVDIRSVTPLLSHCDPAFRFWLKRINCDEPALLAVFDWIGRVNLRLFQAFEDRFAETEKGRRENARARDGGASGGA